MRESCHRTSRKRDICRCRRESSARRRDIPSARRAQPPGYCSVVACPEVPDPVSRSSALHSQDTGAPACTTHAGAPSAESWPQVHTPSQKDGFARLWPIPDVSSRGESAHRKRARHSPRRLNRRSRGMCAVGDRRSQTPQPFYSLQNRTRQLRLPMRARSVAGIIHDHLLRPGDDVDELSGLDGPAVWEGLGTHRPRPQMTSSAAEHPGKPR